MPRQSRSNLSIYTYFHVCARGNRGEPIFLEDEDYRYYLKVLEKSRRKSGLTCFAYCLMPNHLHLLFLCPSVRMLSKHMQSVHVSYARFFNQKYHVTGHLFQDRFSSWVIQNEGHLMSAKEYVENNPVAASLVNKKEEWKWGSASSGDESYVTIEEIER